MGISRDSYHMAYGRRCAHSLSSLFVFAAYGRLFSYVNNNALIMGVWIGTNDATRFVRIGPYVGVQIVMNTKRLIRPNRVSFGPIWNDSGECVFLYSFRFGRKCVRRFGRICFLVSVPIWIQIRGGVRTNRYFVRPNWNALSICDRSINAHLRAKPIIPCAYQWIILTQYTPIVFISEIGRYINFHQLGTSWVI